MLRKAFIIGLVSLWASHAWAAEKGESYQVATQSSLESAIRENARQAGVSERWVESRLAEARDLRSAGIDPTPYLAKLSEGLAKHVPQDRIETALDKQRSALQQANQLAGNMGRRHPETVAAAAQMIAAGASRDDVDALFDASRNAPEPSRRFLSLSFGAAGLKNAGVGWHEASSFQATMAKHDLSSDDLDDVNQAVAAAVRDGLVGPRDLPRLADGELRNGGDARRFVTEIRGQSSRVSDDDHGQDKADKRKDHETKSKTDTKGNSDHTTGNQGGDQNTRGKSAH